MQNAERPEIREVPMIHAEHALTFARGIKARDEIGQPTRADLVWRSVAVEGGIHAMPLQE